jgi:Skp family chaperone for outer membrane proteins
MVRFTRPLGVLLAACALVGTLLAPTAGRAANDKEVEGPAYVDLAKVLTEFRKTSAFSKYQVKLRDQAKQFDDEMQTLAQLRYCTDAERTEGLALKAKPNLNNKEKARLAELIKKGESVDNEIAALSQKPKPTSEESARIVELSKMRTEAVKSLAKQQADRRDQLRAMEGNLMADVENDLLKMVEKLAKDQKLTTIYERRAVLVGGTDLTDQVIKKLPK